MTEKMYLPVFSGKIDDGGKIVLYKHAEREEELFIRRDDGELWALSPGTEIEFTFSLEDWTFSLTVTAPPLIPLPHWTGTAKGTKRELVEEEAR